jgi:hypothetical protein
MLSPLAVAASIRPSARFRRSAVLRRAGRGALRRNSKCRAGRGRRGFEDRRAKLSIQFSFLQPHTLAATILRNEFNSGGFERKPQGLDSSRRHVSPVSGVSACETELAT